jgi:hypothetical protein
VFRQNQNYFSSNDPAIINRLLEWDIRQDIERFTTGATVSFSPVANLTNRVTVGYDFSLQGTSNLRPFGFVARPQGGVDANTYEKRLLTFEYVGSLGFSISSGLKSTASWGGQAVGDESHRLEAWGEGFPGAANPTISSASSTVGYEERDKNWNAGFFFQNVFDLNNKYFLTLGLRIDGNSAFGKGFGLQAYPKASGSWVISEETFWPDQLGEVKLRTAYGQSGRAPGVFDAVRTWTNSGLAGVPAFVPQNVGNADLGPEVTAEFEAGFDGSWVGDRLRSTFTYYRQVTSDALLDRQQIPSLGFTASQLSNIGKVENKGTETSLEVTAVQRPSWGLDLGVNYSTNRNKVLEWSEPNSDRVGRPISYSTWTDVRNPDAIGVPTTCVVDAAGNFTGDPNKPCFESSTLTVGYPQVLPPTIINGFSTVRMPYGILLSARGEYRGGNYGSRNPISISRSVRSPACLPYYANEQDVALKSGIPGIWVARCTPSLGQGYTLKSDYFKLRSVTATIPMDFAFPDQVQTATLTLTLGNSYTWVRETLFGAYGVESLGNAGANSTALGSTERIPPPVTLRASLRVTF